MAKRTLFTEATPTASEQPLAEATDLFLQRWVPRAQQDAARKELDDLIDLACRVEPPA